MSYELGDIIPATARRGITGAPLAKPLWHALRVVPQKERAAREILKAAGVYAFYPTEQRVRFHQGAKIVTERPVVTQIVYARFRAEPQWDVMKARRVITGVFCHGTTPICLGRDTIRRIQGLPTEAERIAAELEEMMRVHPGERVEIIAGPLEGFFVDITKVKDSQLWWTGVDGMFANARGEIKRDDVRKLG